MKEQIKSRTKKTGIEIILLTEKVPDSVSSGIIANQIIN
jgi:hypothetical protein